MAISPFVNDRVLVELPDVKSVVLSALNHEDKDTLLILWGMGVYPGRNANGSAWRPSLFSLHQKHGGYNPVLGLDLPVDLTSEELKGLSAIAQARYKALGGAFHGNEPEVGFVIAGCQTLVLEKTEEGWASFMADAPSRKTPDVDLHSLYLRFKNQAGD